MDDDINERSPNVDDNVVNYDSDISHILHLVIQTLLFGIGLFIHVKIIQQSKADRSKAWLIHISHSLVVTFHYGIRVPFQAITHFVPHLSSYIGSWVCYIAAFNFFYGFQAVSAHSLWIAVEKYILIIHTMKARAFGEEHIEKIFCCLHVMCPFLLSIIAMLTTNYETRADVKSCFGLTAESLEPSNSSVSGRSNFIFCDVSGYSETNVIVPYVVQFFCVSRTVLNIIVGTNLPEAFFYYKIFKSMKR